MIVSGSALERAGDKLGDFLPQLAGAFALLAVGLLLAMIAGRLVRRALQVAGLDELGERWRVHDTLESAGLRRSLAALSGTAVKLILSVIVIFAALMLLGLEPLSDSLNQAVLFLPDLLVAFALVLTGFVTAGWVRERLDRFTYQMDFPVPLGQLGQIATLAIFVITAAAQVGVSSQILTLVVGIVLAAVTATFALAFGLGGREVARAINAGRFIRHAYDVGQIIEVGEVRGRILAIDPDATMVATAGGRVRLPNHLLLESVVRIDDSAGTD